MLFNYSIEAPICLNSETKLYIINSSIRTGAVNPRLFLNALIQDEVVGCEALQFSSVFLKGSYYHSISTRH